MYCPHPLHPYPVNKLYVLLLLVLLVPLRVITTAFPPHKCLHPGEGFFPGWLWVRKLNGWPWWYISLQSGCPITVKIRRYILSRHCFVSSMLLHLIANLVLLMLACVYLSIEREVYIIFRVIYCFNTYICITNGENIFRKTDSDILKYLQENWFRYFIPRQQILNVF